MDLRTELSGGVVLRESDHRYFNTKNAKEYKSVSRIIDMFREPFDQQGQSRRSAASELKREGARITDDAIEIRAAELRQKWTTKGNNSMVRGNEFHKSFENFDLNLNPEPRHLPCIIRIHNELFKDYHVFIPEACISSNIYGIAGTSDKVMQRAPGKKGILDFYDYKTNENGITQHSPYSKYFINGLGHLEESKYNGYALQLSLYALMALAKGFSIGTLTLISVPDPMSVTGEYKALPVPFMKMEAEYMMEAYLKKAA